MTSTLAQMTVLLLLGTLWRFFKPAGLTAEQTRLVLTQVVFYILLPALVLSALWRVEIGKQTLYIALISGASILFSGGSLWGLLHFFRLSNKQAGALILAASIPNVTYLGLPILESTFGSFGRSIAIQFDLFGCEPWLFTLGILVAQHYGETKQAQKENLFLSLFKIPPIWAAIVAVTLNINHIEIPSSLDNILSLLTPAVAPLMLLSLGMGLQWQSLHWRNLPKIMPVLLFKMLLMPLFALAIAWQLGMTGDFLSASIMEVAMPSMMFGIVLCDRYKLDSSLYAMTVTVSTVLSLLTLPLWYEFLQQF